MVGLLKTCKPAAPARVHLLLAALMWTVVGACLCYVGSRWVLAGDVTRKTAFLVLIGAVAMGMAKARFALRRAAGRTVDRIRARGDGRCVGGFLSWQSWLFVLFMMGFGRLLRGGLLPCFIIGVVYLAVGTALLVASGHIWLAWYRHNADL